MNDKLDRQYVCGAPGCPQQFQSEEHLMVHRHKHEMTLKFSSIKADVTFTDQTPTPTQFLQNCEEVGLFKEIEEEFLQAEEEEKSKQILSHNESSCSDQQHLRVQLHVQQTHSQQQLLHAHTLHLHHASPQAAVMGPSCSLATTQAQSTLSLSGPAPGSLSSLLHMRNRHRQPLPASLPGTLPDPAMQGASAQHMPVEKQMPCIMGLPGPTHNPSCSSPQRSKPSIGLHYQQHHTGMIARNNPMEHMMELMSHRLQAPPLQHHHHHPHHTHPQAPPISNQPRCHAPPSTHLSNTHGQQLLQTGNPQHSQVHRSPPAHVHQGSPPAPPLPAGVQLSPVAQQVQLSLQQSNAQSTPHLGGSCTAGGAAGVGPNRRRRTNDQDPDERRQKFLERNRAAATRCRQKRKLWVSSLEKKAEELTHTNLQLQNEVTSLKSEVGQLKQILLTHKDCPVTVQQREKQGFQSE